MCLAISGSFCNLSAAMDDKVTSFLIFFGGFYEKQKRKRSAEETTHLAWSELVPTTMEIRSVDCGCPEGLPVGGSDLFARLGVVSGGLLLLWRSLVQALAVQGVAGNVVEKTFRFVVPLSDHRGSRGGFPG